MRISTRRSLGLAALVGVAFVSVGEQRLPAGDWPQFRGPTGQGNATGRSSPVRFGDAANVQWKSGVAGRGHSSPVVQGGRVWMTTALEDGKSLRAICLELESGKTLHDVEVFRPAEPVSINAKNSHASPTPVLEEGRVYVHFGSMGTAALDASTGRILWRNDSLVVDHKEGPGSSPVLVDGLLILTLDGKDEQYIVALDPKTGKVRWKTPRSAPFRSDAEFRKAYSTPLVIEVDGRRQLVAPGADQTQSYDPKTGDELWQVRYTGFSNVPRPLFADGMVLICTGYFKPELWAIRPDGKGEVTRSHVAWKYGRQIPANPSPIVVDGLVYVVSDNGVLTCLDLATGEQVWLQRLGGNFWASPIAVEGRLYFSSEEGKVFVLKSGRTYDLLATNVLDRPIMASPAVVDHTLLFRTVATVYRFAADDRP